MLWFCTSLPPWPDHGAAARPSAAFELACRDSKWLGWAGNLWAMRPATRFPTWGAGERIRTAGLPFTRRLLCLLSYTGNNSVHGSPPRP